jgi:hypothetical protein
MNQNSLIDYYEDLQVSSNADLETIERVYRLLATQTIMARATLKNLLELQKPIKCSLILKSGPRLMFNMKKNALANLKTYLKHPAQRALKQIRGYGIQFFQYSMSKLGRIRRIPGLACGNWKN